MHDEDQVAAHAPIEQIMAHNEENSGHFDNKVTHESLLMYVVHKNDEHVYKIKEQIIN